MTNEEATRDGYGTALLELGQDERIVALDADLSDSTRSNKFAKVYPSRFFNMGISEASMIGTAAGLATCGKIPFASSFASFLINRAYDQILILVAYSKNNVKIVGSHAGIATGEDGPTVQALSDVAMLRAMPNMSIISPADAKEAEEATKYMAFHNGPMYLRVARPKTPLVFGEDYKFDFGKIYRVVDGSDIIIVSTGITLANCLEASKLLKKNGISAAVANAPTIKPFDVDFIEKCSKSFSAIITVEDHNIIGGLGSAVAECMATSGAKLMRLGLNDRFHESGSMAALYKKYGLDANGIAESISSFLR